MTIVPSAGPLLALMLAMQGGQGDRPAGRIQWDALPQLDFRVPLTIAPEMTAYVAGESRSGRCPPPAIEGGRSVVRADVAVLLAASQPGSHVYSATQCELPDSNASVACPCGIRGGLPHLLLSNRQDGGGDHCQLSWRPQLALPRPTSL